MQITLRFQRLKKKNASFDAKVPVTVQLDGQETEAFDFTNPLAEADLADLRWYLEEYAVYPYLDHARRAEQIEPRLREWGEALFKAVFMADSEESTQAYGLFKEFLGERSQSDALVIDTTEPRVLRLPWELLAEEGGFLFGRKPPITVLRRLHKAGKANLKQFELPVRILMVTCRPEGGGFIDPRSIAAPLLDALQGLGERVQVEFLRPPTLSALDDRLNDAAKPSVHIVHFDGHGVYDPGVGLGFLLFEDDEHKPARVDAEQLGTLLN